MPFFSSWQAFALGSAFFAGLTAILGKLGVEGLNSNLATLIRTVVIIIITAAIVSVRGEWAWPREARLSSLACWSSPGRDQARSQELLRKVLILQSLP